MWELTGYYLWEQEDALTLSDPGQFATFFVNPPFGLEGNSGLWDNADVMTLALRTTLGNGEFNYRHWFGTGPFGFQTITGLRYVDLQEKLDIITDDEGLTDGTDPTMVAKYRVRTHNHLMGMQFGCGPHVQLCDWLGVGCEAQGHGSPIALTWTIIINRGDSESSRHGFRSSTHFAHLYELGASVEFCKGPVQLRFGYHAMWC